jgi:hypothetical protein
VIIISGKAKKSGKSDIGELRSYYKSLTLSQKREFITKLKQKVSELKSEKYKDFLLECIGDYNAAVQKLKKAEKPKPEKPDISSEIFARAIASMLSGYHDGPAKRPSIVGRWERLADSKVIYYAFNEDGSFETNETANQEKLQGHYTYDMDGQIFIDPHEILQINSLMVSVSGATMAISYANGKMYDYKRKQV